AGSLPEDDRRIKVLISIIETSAGLRILIHAPDYDLSGIPEVNLAFHKRIRLTQSGESGLDPVSLIKDLEEIVELIY
ncbi:MAG: hypothetical protein NTV01_10885, partial [Bacteroidia bacterium]|nr:hypothetical protein [Bacteroidia bacterium]